MILAIEGLTHRHPDGTLALRGLDFTVAEGEKLVLLGSNGCGKTTLLRILDGLIEPSEGSIHYLGQRLDARRLRDREFVLRFRREVGLLFQNPDSMLFQPTVREEIAFGPRQLEREDTDARVEHWARVLGVERLLDRPPFRLSSGEKQRVALAALLINDPRLLLLDEPTANLDPRSTGWLVDFLQELPLTVITTTHNLSLAAELGSRALILGEEHELLHDGPLNGVLQDLELLERANLVHSHRHRHGSVEHRHPHVHDWD